MLYLLNGTVLLFCQLCSIVTKYLREINLQDERFLFSSDFRGFGPGSLGSVASRSVAGLCILVEAYVGAKLIAPWWSRSKEKKLVFVTQTTNLGIYEWANASTRSELLRSRVHPEAYL